jgi:hypothetical protein
MAREIVPIPVPQRKGRALLIDPDETPGHLAEGVGETRPAFPGRHGPVIGRGARSDHGHRTGTGDASAAGPRRAGDLSDIDLFELNEAFASQSLAVLRGLGLAGCAARSGHHLHWCRNGIALLLESV